MAPTRSGGEWVKLFGIIGLVLMVAWGGLYVSKLRYSNGWVRDGDGFVLGTDFLNSWLMARAGLHEKAPEQNYDIRQYNYQLNETVGDTNYPIQQWSYAPNYMLVMLPFGALPYLAAWALFMTLSIGVLMLILRRFYALKLWPGMAAVFGTPASLLALMSGQIALLATGAQFLAWRWMDSKPWLAGALIGLLSVKPQLGLLYPFFFLATRRWKCFAAAALTSVALILLSILCWGVAPWRHYLNEGLHNQLTYVLMDPPHSVMAFMPTLYMDLRMVGLGHGLALGMQGLVALAAVAMLFTRSFRRANTSLQLVIFAALCAAATPYLMAYDLLFLSAAVLVFLSAHAVSRVHAYLLMALVLLPVLHMLCVNMGIAGSALLPLIVAILLLFGCHAHQQYSE